MTALDQILIGIEKLPISGKKKNEYMLELMYVSTDEKHSFRPPYRLTSKSLGRSSFDLNNTFWWSYTFKRLPYWHQLHRQLTRS